MGEDEARGRLRVVREHLSGAAIVADLGGRIVKRRAMASCWSFPPSSRPSMRDRDPKLMVERSGDTPEAKRIVYRIGVNLGDVLIEGDDILGDGVNIAARLEAICKPGGV